MRQFRANKLPVIGLAFRPDGQALTARFGRARFLGTWDLGTGAYERKTGSVESVTGFAYAPDGSAVVVGGGNLAARVFALPGWGGLAELVVGRSPVGGTAVAFAPATDPRRRWVAAAGTEVQLRNLATGQIEADFPDGEYAALAFSPDGEVLAAANDRAVVGWSVGPVRERFAALFGGPVRQLAYSPDGRWLAVGHGLGVEVRPADDPTGWRPALAPDPADLAFTPDSRLLAVADGTAAVKLFDPESGAAVREYDWGIGAVTAVAFSPDGTLAAAGGERGRVAVWDLDG